VKGEKVILSKNFIKPIGRKRQRRNKKTGDRLRKDIHKNGLNFKNEFGNSDSTAGQALRNIAFPKRGRLYE
jgi:hypothetical protein